MEVSITGFAFTNPKGGTGLSDGSFGREKFEGEAIVTLTSGFFDYEIGWRFKGEAVNAPLKDYMQRHASPDDQTVLYGEFDLVDCSEVSKLSAFLAKLECEEFESFQNRVKELLRAQPAASCAVFPSSCAIIHNNNLFYASALAAGGFELDNLVDPDVSAWDQQWKAELTRWFDNPVFAPLNDKDLAEIASCFF